MGYAHHSCMAPRRRNYRSYSLRPSSDGRILRPHMSPLFLSPLKQAGCGPAAQAFFEEVAFYNHYNERDIDRYHWNTAKFKTLWRTKFAVLMARERGRIGSNAALGDMPKRLQAHSYDEMNEGPAR